MIKGWRGRDGDLEPVPFECETFGYPHRTSVGESMFANTHFLTEAEAWESIKASVEAGVSLSGDAITLCRDNLSNAERRAGDSAADYAAAMRGYQDFKRRIQLRSAWGTK